MCTSSERRGHRFFVIGLALLPVVTAVNLLILQPRAERGAASDAIIGAMYGVTIGLLVVGVYARRKQRRG